MSVRRYSFGLDGRPIDEGTAFELLPARSGRTTLAQVVWASLFTDAPTDGLPRAGSWQHSIRTVRASTIHALRAEPVTATLAQRVRTAAAEALAWLVDDLETAERVNVSAEVAGRRGIVINIDIRRGAASAWASLWESVNG